MTSDESDAAPDSGIAQYASAELYRLLLESVRDYSIYALDPHGNVITWNAGAARLKGYEADEIVGHNFSVFFPREAVLAGAPARELAIAARDGSYTHEAWRVRKDGSRFWAHLTLTALREKGELVGFAKVTRDLSAQQGAHEALRESEQRFQLLVEGVRGYAILMLDVNGHIASWNSGAEILKQYRADEIIGRHFSTFYPAEDVAAGKPARELEIASRTGKYEEEGWRVRKDGTLFWASVLITALRSPQGTLLGFAKVTRDLTERHATHKQAIADARMLAEAEASSRTKSQFLTSLSHELRTPINATIGYSGLLQMGIGGDLTAQQREYLTRIAQTQQHLLAIVNSLLDYGGVEAGELRYDLAPTPLRGIIERMSQMVEPQALARGITLHVNECPPALLVLVDRTRAEQVLLNLLANAVKFTPPAGRVTVTCTATDEVAVVTVQDTGPGVPPESHEAVFAPFVQLGRTLTSGHEGTGLGLAISRRLARAMGGDVTIAPESGEGASFSVTLPIAIEE